MKALHQVYFTRCTQTRCRWYLECTIELEALIQTGETSYGINSHWSIRNIDVNIVIVYVQMIHHYQESVGYWRDYSSSQLRLHRQFLWHCTVQGDHLRKYHLYLFLFFSNYQENTINNSFLSLQFTKLAESVDLDVWSPACLPDQVSKSVCFPCT